MAIKTININWYLIIFGLIAFYFSTKLVHHEINQNFLIPIEVVVAADLKNETGRRAEYGVKFEALEYRCEFGIYQAAAITGDWSALKTIKQGDQLTLQIYRNKSAVLMEEDAVVPVFGIASAQQIFFDVAQYDAASQRYWFKFQVMAMLVALLFFVNGLGWGSKLINLVFMVAFIVLIVVIKVG